MAIKQPPINTEGQLEGRQRPIVKPVLAKTFPNRETERNLATVPAKDKSGVNLALAIGVRLEVLATGVETVPREAAERVPAIEADPPVQTLGGGVPSVVRVEVQHVLAAHAAAPAWAPGAVADGGGRQPWRR
jgi:hypothetical protein